MVVSERPPIPPRGSRFGNYLIGLAVLGAFGVTLYRNDVLRQVAKSAGQEQTYLQIERSLGSPGFGTPRAIEQLAEHTPKLEADTLSTVVPATPERTPSAAAAVEPAAAVPEPVAAAPAASSAPAAQESPAAERTEEPKSNSKRVAASAKPSLESTVAAQVGTRTKRSKAERPTAERSAPRREREPQREEPSKNLGFTGSSNSFDPLNGKL